MTIHSNRFLPSPQGHNRRLLPCYFTLFLGLFLFATPGFSTIRYVKPVANGNGSGSSWANASSNLQAMINASTPGDQVWVAAGTYKPTTGNDRTISFSMKNGVAIYGGFAGGETALTQRRWRENETILSGDIGTADKADNTYHVILNNNNGLNNSAVLDGFTITAGYSNPNTRFPFFNGGGMLNVGSSPSLINCTFLENLAAHGGGMFNNNSSPTLTNCVFNGNTAKHSPHPDGGGMFNNNSSPVLVNCIFLGNSADIGGGMYNNNSSPQLTNCTISGNSSGSNGGGIYSQAGGQPVLTNCIIWGNQNGEITGRPAAVTYSIVKGGYAGVGNLDADPLFIGGLQNDPNNINALRLSFCSPAIDAALSGAAPTNDFSGNQRLLRPSGEMRPRTAEEVVEAIDRSQRMQQQLDAYMDYMYEQQFLLEELYKAGEVTQQQYESSKVWNNPKPVDPTGADIGAFEYSTNESNQLIVSKGSISSFGNVDGRYILSADTYQAAQGANTQTNCPCWTRTEGAFPVSIGKIDGEWLFFKSATCPENPFSVPIAPIGNSSGCNPTSIPGISWCP
ncbi:MAG: right-handed parallel beta-helix repeat-containing protein [Lewinellaceae bacterium]|nr:right-handed parallel beta-helix repeat-containing protein [Lewinellaceae bacterium]